ncbi:MAG: efflux RND transporter periplasmic adaptor subunit, partial [Myxococcaceae bacterium]
QPALNPESRTLQVRFQVEQPGPGVLLRPDMVATVEIRSPVAYEVVAVPEQAVIRSGERTIAIIALGRGYFEPREVRLGNSAEGFVEVREGLRAGERIVTSSQFLIDSESNLRSALGTMAGPDGSGAPSPPGVPDAGAAAHPHPMHR